MTTVQAAKRELRQRIRPVLSSITQELIATQSSVVTRQFLSLPEYQTARRISVFMSMPNEVSTAGIVRDAFNQRKQVYVPYVHSLNPKPAKGRASVLEMLQLRSIEDYESLQPDNWGIPSLDAQTVPERMNCLGGYGVSGEHKEQNTGGLDLIVMPGVAFDENFQRLGYGKGFYDHFLDRYMNETFATVPKPYLAAIALKEQLLPPDENVPMGELDYPVDAIVLGNGRILRRQN